MEEIFKKTDSSHLDMQTLTFFTEGNSFAGEKTKNPKTQLMMRYWVRPNKETQQLEAFVWTTDVCFACSCEKKEGKFPMTDEGVEEVCAWLHEKFDELS